MKKDTLRYVVLAILGFSLYCGIEILFRNQSYRVSGLMGMVALLLLDGINDRISWDIPLVVQCGMGGLLITLMELLVGLADKFIWHIGMWDYSNIPLNFMGVICVPFTIAWCFLSVVGILVADSINYYMFHLDPQPYYRSLTGKILFKLPEKECHK